MPIPPGPPASLLLFEVAVDIRIGQLLQCISESARCRSPSSEVYWFRSSHPSEDQNTKDLVRSNEASTVNEYLLSELLSHAAHHTPYSTQHQHHAHAAWAAGTTLVLWGCGRYTHGGMPMPPGLPASLLFFGVAVDMPFET